ncbi:MAG: phospho-sugar mutase [Eubacterium sp.]|nr:phospho-sugar mutase [Eubacterium sp.]
MEENPENKASFNEFRRWLERTKGDKYHEKLVEIKDNPDEITDAFTGKLTLTASGLLGLIGPGTNRINKYVIRRTTQGISDYLKREHKPVSVVIGYDSRRGSRYFAYEAASVLRGNLIKPYLFRELVPASLLSYAVKYLECDLGIMITASQNHKIYNGYRVYNSEGYLISEETAAEMQKEIDKNDYFAPDIFMDNKSGIYQVDDQVARDFCDRIVSSVKLPDPALYDGFRVIYSPLYGAGKACFTDVMRKSGIRYELVSNQADPDKEFPTCPVPNPEKIMSYNESFKWLDEHGGDIIITHDADAGRAGCAIEHDGMRTVLTGNQTGLLLLDYLCHIRPPKEGQIMIKSIAASPLAVKIAEKNGLKVITSVTGFRNAGSIIDSLEKEGRGDDFYFALEESDGYLIDPFIKDKDGISAALYICEMAAFHKKRGKNLIERLYELYNEYGICVDKTRNYFFSGASGIKTISSIMNYFRTSVTQTIGGRNIVKKTDYMTAETGPAVDCVEFDLDDSSKLIIKPSDTDAIMKIYSFETCDFTEVEKDIADIIDRFKSVMKDN